MSKNLNQRIAEWSELVEDAARNMGYAKAADVPDTEVEYLLHTVACLEARQKEVA